MLLARRAAASRSANAAAGVQSLAPLRASLCGRGGSGVAAACRGVGTDRGSSTGFDVGAFRSGSGTREAAGGSDATVEPESEPDDCRDALVPGIGSPVCSRERASSPRAAAVSDPRVDAEGVGFFAGGASVGAESAGAAGAAAAGGAEATGGAAGGGGVAGGAAGAGGVVATAGGAGGGDGAEGGASWGRSNGPPRSASDSDLASDHSESDCGSRP